MRKIFQYILMAVAVVATASCSNEQDEPMQPAHNGTLQFVVSDFPAFGENPESRASQIGIPDAGKTAWEAGDEIIVTLISPKYGEQNASLIYDGSKWNLYGSLSYIENETPTVSAIYAPCYEVGEVGLRQIRVGMLRGMTEYLEAANCTIENGIISISFAGVIRNYSRLRIAGLEGQTYTVTTTGFTTPEGIIPEATEPYTLPADEKGNAYLYGTFAEGATVTVKQGEVTLADYQFTAETKHGKSYTLEARPIIDLSQYTEGATVNITEDCVIIGDGTEHNITLNITADATVIFDVRTSGVNLGGSITVADGKTLTLLVEGNAEHTVKGGISLGNSSNVIIEGDLTQENNKLTVTVSDGNAGIGANNGVIAGDITIRNARVDATGSGSSSEPYVSGAGIGTANASMGDILIEGSTITAAGGYYGKYSHAAAIGMGSHVGTVGNITLKDSKITANNNGDGLASVIGAGGQRNGDPGVGTLGDIIITNTDLNLSMAIYNMNSYAAIIGPGIGYSDCYVNMGKIVFTDVTQTQLDEMISNWLPSNFYYLYALGKGTMGIDNEYQTFEGVWVSDGNGGIVQIGDESGYSWQEFTGF